MHTIDNASICMYTCMCIVCLFGTPYSYILYTILIDLKTSINDVGSIIQQQFQPVYNLKLFFAKSSRLLNDIQWNKNYLEFAWFSISKYSSLAFSNK